MDAVYLLGHSSARKNMARRSLDQTSKAHDGLNYLSSSETQGSNKNKVTPLRPRHPVKNFLWILCSATNYLAMVCSSASKAARNPHSQPGQI